MEKTLKQVLDELSKAQCAYRFSSVGESACISVDGLMDSLRPQAVMQRNLRKSAQCAAGSI
ncbi:MAG: hypothetical protein WC792_05885 [Candidatus Micrarchaeia archaeon]